MEATSIYQGALMEHNAYPSCKYELENATCSHEGVNPSCGDDITLSLMLDGDIIEEAAFAGSGCAISQASTDIMAELVTGHTVDEARQLVEAFRGLIHGEEVPDELRAKLGEALELEGVAKMPARVKCALLGWRTLGEMLDERNEMRNEQEEQ